MLKLLERILRLILDPKYVNHFNMQKLFYILLSETITSESHYHDSKKHQNINFKLITNFNKLGILKNRLFYLKKKLGSTHKFTKFYEAKICNFQIDFD